MHVLMEHSTVRCGLAARHMLGRTGTERARSETAGIDADPALDHDPTLLLAALQAIDSRRRALEWLVEADLLRLCMV